MLSVCEFGYTLKQFVPRFFLHFLIKYLLNPLIATLKNESLSLIPLVS